MSGPQFIELEASATYGATLCKLRREQRAAFARAAQPALFDLKLERRPEQQRTAAVRYLEPSLFTGLCHTGGKMTDEQPFIDYWNAGAAALFRLFGIDGSAAPPSSMPFRRDPRGRQGEGTVAAAASCQ
jgi:hypothetical protein